MSHRTPSAQAELDKGEVRVSAADTALERPTYHCVDLAGGCGMINKGLIGDTHEAVCLMTLTQYDHCS